MSNFRAVSDSLSQQAVDDLAHARERFERSTANLTEAISGFAPVPGMMTAAQHVAHTARVIDWLMEGVFQPSGFDMNFEDQIKAVLGVTSLSSARAWFEKSMTGAIDLLAAQSDAELMAPLPPGPVLGGRPRLGVVREIVDHTAHHRGVLTAYARLNQIVPPDPYGM